MRPPTPTCLLKPTPCSIFASSHQMGDAQVVRLLVFRVGNLTCAAAAEVVREILPRLETTRIPGAPPVVAGAGEDPRRSPSRWQGGGALLAPPESAPGS